MLCYHYAYINTDTSQRYGENALALARALSYKSGEANALLNLGLCMTKKGEYKTALELLNKALVSYEKINDRRGIYKTYVNIGNLHRRQAQYPKAIYYYLQCLKISEENKDSAEIAGSYLNLGMVYSYQEKYDLSREYYLKGYAIASALNDLDVMADIKMNIAGDNFEMKKLKEARKEYEDVLLIYEKIGDKWQSASTISNIGQIYALEKNYDKALEYNFKAFDVLKGMGDKLSMGLQYSAIAQVYQEMKRFDVAAEYFSKSIDIFNEVGDLQHMKEAYGNLSELYYEKSDFKRAFQYQKLYADLIQKIFSTESQKQIAEMSAKYETEKKEKKILLLNKENEKQSALAAADSRRHRIIIISVSIILLIISILALFIYRSYRQKQKANEIIAAQKKEVEHQKELVVEKNKEITDSIHYALRIQNALLATEEILKENLNEHFTLFMPKDIVSGDFYWAVETGTHFYLAVCDSTGHGVPGAFMSLLNMGFLSEAIKEKGIISPNEILDFVRMRLVQTVSKGQQKDGMDGILICFEKKSAKITYAAAHNTPVLISNGEIYDLKADKMPVGNSERYDPFTLQIIEAKKGDVIYLFTDGYADQFGGPKGKKFKYKQLNEILLANASLPMEEQKTMLKQTILNWTGTLEQVDDVCVIGIRI